MTPAQQARWDRIVGFSFTPSDALITFADKLVDKTGWTRGKAERAIVEYRRFLLLAAEAGHPVSPSPTVDEVWHLHLLYTRNYWDELCPNVLGFRLHHEPATGTPNDRAKIDDWYARTVASYHSIFGETAPSDVWPTRLSSATSIRVDPLANIVLPRAVWRFMWVALSGLILIAGAAILWLASRAS